MSVATTARPAATARLRLWLRLLKTARWIEDDLRRRFRDEFATTLPRFDVMSALSRHPEGLRMSEISGLLRVSNGNVTGIVDRLADEGLAQRTAVAGDRRASRVHLTAKGRAAFDAQAARHAAWIDALLADYAPAEAEVATARLDALLSTLEDRTP